MQPWLLRGVAMAIAHAAIRCGLGWGVTAFPTDGSLQRMAAVAVAVLIALVAGGIDGIVDARRHSNPEQGIDLTQRWFKAAIAAGLLSGLAGWALGRFWLPGIGQAGLGFEVTAGACFTALLVLAPAVAGAAVGRRLQTRSAAAAT